MTSVMPGLLPASQGIQFTARPALRTRDSLTSSQSHGKPVHTSPALGSKLNRPSSAVDPNAKLSSIEVEALLREKVRSKFSSLQQAFQTYDIDQALSVTKGEFRRAIETFCMPLSTEQFEAVLAKVDKNNNGTVKYCDFLDKFNGKRESNSRSDSWLNGKNRLNPTTPPGDVNTDMVEKMLKQKISKNLRQVVKALRLFDYNRDGKIQRHEMRRVLENFCFRFTDQQFDKLWQRYDYQHAGVLEYMNFLRRLGVLLDKELSSGDQAKNLLSWNTAEDRRGDELNRKVILQSTLVNKGLNFDQIELEFRKLMRKNYLGIKKACMARDSHLDGWLKIEDLKAILDQFTVHMSDQLFAQLMDRFQIKASGTVKWEFFLSKFQDPQSFGNGQTIPIKPSHKWFPLRGGDAGIPTGDVWTLLYKHVHDHHPTLKQAFLQCDKNRNGTVSRKELREVFNKMNFRLSDEQFKKLLTYIDPDQTNRISYHAFLELFEEKETLAGHKWLNSCHRVNDTKPTLMAWKTVEDVLREKITEYWKPFSDNIMKHDTEGDGLIAPKFLKRALDRHVLPVTDDHFEHLLSRVSEQKGGKVNYVEFLEMLDVSVSPGDLVGISTQITDGNVLSETLRKEDLRDRIVQLDKNLCNKSSFLSADEVIYKLKDRMSQHNVQIRKSFLYFAGNNRARISKKNFREMLASLDMFLTDDQFKQLTSKLNFQSNFMNYTDFVASFDDPSGVGPHQEIVRTGNHRVNPIRGDEYGMTALEAESKLRGKLRENFADLRGAFYKFDDDHNGLLTKENFRRLLDTFMVLISDEEFEKLCVRLGLHKRSRISYQDFLDRFEIRDTAEGHKWLNSVHKYNEVKAVQPMTAEQVHKLLQEKAHRHWNDLAKAFLSLDRDGNGVITRKELKHVLSRFTLPLSRDDFNKLWAMYDVEGKGYVSHADFLERLGASQYAPGDQQGVSKHILLQNQFALDDHLRDQQAKQEQITLNQAQRSAEMSAEEVHRILKDKIRDNYSHYYTAFRKYDTRKKGCLSVRDVQQVLIDLNYFITEQEFFRLLEILGLTTRNSKLNYEDFLRGFEDGRRSSYGQRDTDVTIVEFDNLSPEEAELKLRDRVAAEFHMLKKAMTAFDKQQTGKIPTADFRRLLDLFCFRLTDSQFRFLLNRLYTGADNQVNYRNFLDQYRVDEHEDTEKWLQQGDDSLAANLQPLTLDEVTAQLREAVSAHFYILAKEFADLDYAKIGVIGRDDFRELLDKHIIRLSDAQFEELWGMLPVNEFGNVDYREFLKEYSSEAPNDLAGVPSASQSSPIKPFTPLKRPRSTLSQSHSLTRASMVRPMTMMSRAASRSTTPMVNAATVELQLTQQICRHWKEIQRQCRERDTDNTGTISAYDFRDILTSLSVDVRGDDFHKLALKYELQESGQFSYVEFLRHFMLTLKPSEGSSLLLRPRITPPNILKIEEENCNNSYNRAEEPAAGSRLQDGVRRHWKDMRRSFRKIDGSGSGVVNPLDFRRILKQHSIDLSEEEFYQVLSSFDQSMDGSVNYNAFIKAYLQ